MRNLILALLVSSTIPAAASDYDDARRSSVFMAAVNACNASIAPESRRALYAKMLKGFDTPSQVNYQVGVEANAINKLPPADRQAMCDAINDQIKSGIR